ncbi:hypothetical protein MMC2321_02316 [Chitinophaga sp. MM2321]
MSTKTKATQTRYDYYDLVMHVTARGKAIYGPHFEIEDIDRPIVLKLLTYFLRDERVALDEGIDLNKGILLTGKIGCGKTSLISIIRNLSQEAFKPAIISCRDISFEFGKMGYDVIAKYSKNAFYPYTSIPRIHCFDDLGLETTIKFWGNDCNVMAEILLSRYDLLISHKMLTHVTTNLVSQELEDLYGNRLRSRMRAMFNLIAFDAGTKDKRR